jgi:hypothetical protein
MAQIEGLVLHTLDLNAAPWTLEALEVPPPGKRMEWTQGADADGALLLRDPLTENRVVTARVRVDQAASMDDALEQVHELVALLEDAETRVHGLPLHWTPAESTRTGTFQVLAGEIVELPVEPTGQNAGWLQRTPVLTVRMTCAPFMEAAPLADISDDFATNSLGDYLFDTGAGTLSVSGGQLVPSTIATEKRLTHAASPYDLTDSWTTLKYTTGAAVSGASARTGLVARRLDPTNWLMCQVNHASASHYVELYKFDDGSFTKLGGNSSTFSLAPNTAYWLRLRVEGSVLIAEHWTTEPSPEGSPAASVTHTLVGADIGQFGAGVAGRNGMRLLAQATDWRYDAFLVQPNMRRAAAPLLETVVYDVPGDVPALGRLVVTDAAGQTRRHLEWGVADQDLELTAPLLVDSDQLTPAGSAFSLQSADSPYDPNATNPNAISSGVLAGDPTAIAIAGPYAHTGTFRVKARVYATGPDVQLRLKWQVGNGPMRANALQRPPVQLAWTEVDLGTITIDAAALGAAAWTGQLEALSPLGAQLLVDYLLVMPAELHAVARSAYLAQPDGLKARATFNGLSEQAVLHGKAAELGGSWATSGAAGDFYVELDEHEDGIVATIPQRPTKFIKRQVYDAETVARKAILGSQQLVGVQVSMKMFGKQALADRDTLMLLARHQSGGSHVRAEVVADGAYRSLLQVVVSIWSGGVVSSETVIATTTDPITIDTGSTGVEFFTVTLAVTPDGIASAALVDYAGRQVAAVQGFDTRLATGGTLQTGTVGFAAKRVMASGAIGDPTNFDDFSVFELPAEQPALHAGLSTEIRHDGVLRQDTGLTTYSRPGLVRGPGLRIPAAGARDRPTRLAVKAHRYDVEQGPAITHSELLQTQVLYTPRYAVVPR